MNRIPFFFLSSLIVVVFPSFLSASECSLKGERAFDLENSENFEHQIAGSIYQIVTGDIENKDFKRHGIGSLISTDGHMLTSAHIFDVGEKELLNSILKGDIKLYAVNNHRRLTLEFVSTSFEIMRNSISEPDIAVIKFSTNELTELESKRLSPLELDLRSDHRNRKVRYAGFTGGVDSALTQILDVATLNDFDPSDPEYNISYTAGIRGFSGASIIGEQGVVAVYKGQSLPDRKKLADPIEDAKRINKIRDVVPISIVIDKLASINYSNLDQYKKLVADGKFTIADANALFSNDRNTHSLLIYHVVKTNIRDFSDVALALHVIQSTLCRLPAGVILELVNFAVNKAPEVVASKQKSANAMAFKMARNIISNAKLNTDSTPKEFIEAAVNLYSFGVTNLYKSGGEVSPKELNKFAKEFYDSAYYADEIDIDLPEKLQPEDILDSHFIRIAFDNHYSEDKNLSDLYSYKAQQSWKRKEGKENLLYWAAAAVKTSPVHGQGQKFKNLKLRDLRLAMTNLTGTTATIKDAEAFADKIIAADVANFSIKNAQVLLDAHAPAVFNAPPPDQG